MVAMKRQQRPAPVLRRTVTVRGRSYSVLVHRYDANGDMPVYVSSASQTDAYWSVVTDGCGRLVCGCQGWDFTQHCRHIEAARIALAETAALRQSDSNNGEDWDTWADQQQSDEWADGLAAARGPYYD